MKTLTTLLLAVLLCGSAIGAEPVPAATFPDVRMPWVQNYYEMPKQGDITYRELLSYYSSGSKGGSAAAKAFKASPKISAAILAGVQQLADDAAKIKDPRAAIYRRAVDKLTQQFAESGVRADAQAAVADLLKALSKAK